MPQETNLNVSPYFDDFDVNKDYYKVLFKPGYPIQARELNALQSILQNQTEQFGKNIFKEGSLVIPGQIRYENPLYAVEIEETINGIPISLYFDAILGKKLKGSLSGVTAEVVLLLRNTESIRGNYTLYVKYLHSGGEDFTNKIFQSGESLLAVNPIIDSNFSIQSGQEVCNTIFENSNSEGTSVSITEGVYFVRGTFARVSPQTILLDQYSIAPSYKVGFDIIEEFISVDEDESLFDNSQGFSNFAAPGSDRFKITLNLSKKDINDVDTDNFVEILRVRDGILEFISETPEFNLIRDELARRTYDESGNYFVNPFNLFVRDSLNDKVLSSGIYFKDQKTVQGNTPSEDLIVYQIGPGKAYVNGYEAETISTRLVDVEKPRTIQTTDTQTIPYTAGTLFILDNCNGSPVIGLGTDAVVNLMDSRIGESSVVSSGTTIGLARVYDFVPESAYIDDSSRLHLRLFDIQTYSVLTINTPFGGNGISTPSFIEGKRSKATGYLKESVSGDSIELILYETTGDFLENEQLVINGITNGRLIRSVKDYSINDIKSIYSKVENNIFNADLTLSKKSYISNPGTTFTIDDGNIFGGLSNVFSKVLKVGDIISYSNPDISGDPIYNKVISIGSGGTSFAVSGITTVPKICDGVLPEGSFEITNILKIDPEIYSANSSLLTKIGTNSIESINFENNLLKQRKSFKVQSFTEGTITISIDPADVDIFFDSFDEDRFLISYSDGSIENLRFDKYNISTSGKSLTFNGLSKISGNNAIIIATIVNINPNSKIKTLNKVSSLTISNSIYKNSGIGTTSLNDGLSYSEIYGTRVQDKIISLNVPDVVRVLAIYESSDLSDPSLPILQISGNPNGNQNYIVGERIEGKNTGAVGIITKKIDDNKLEFVHLNTNRFIINELVFGIDSKQESILDNTFYGDKNITQNFMFDDGQRDSFYDYSRIIRKGGIQEPSNKIKIIFQNYTINSSDTGEFITANSYPKENFKYDVLEYDGKRLTDYIDIRPRVANYVECSKSPFEFSSRNFASDGQYSRYILCPGENLFLSYSYYLGRIDRVFLNTDGTFEVVKGEPSLSPVPPTLKSDALDIATVYLPPYVFNVDKVNVDMSMHKRYRMSDISLLEDRIERVEKYTTLSMLESKTENFIIRDSETGLDRFKCGFFVDNFSTHEFHDIENPSFRSCIDSSTNSLRPIHYTTAIDLQLGSEAINGVTENFNSKVDQSYVNDLGSPNIRKTGDLITLDYDETEYFRQIYATKTESITPFLVRYWEGIVDLNPSIDSWIEEKYYTTTTFKQVRNFIQRENQNIRIVDGVVVEGQQWVNPPVVQSGVTPSEWINNRSGALSVAASRNLQIQLSQQKFNQSRTAKLSGVRLPNTQLSANISSNTVTPSNTSTNGFQTQAPQTNQNLTRTTTSIQDNISTPPLIIPKTGSIQSSNTQSTAFTGSFAQKNRTQINTNVNTIIYPEEIFASDSITQSKSNYTEVVTYVRSRNIEFDTKSLRPITRFYPFFGSIDVSEYVIPKLLEIEMISGKFEIGETVESDPLFIDRKISFRLCKPNHRTGPFDGSAPPTVVNPIPLIDFSTGDVLQNDQSLIPVSDVFKLNPYTQQTIQEEYSESSTFLNVDTRSLQHPSEVDYYGSVSVNMKLIGKTSGSVARITNVRLISDNSGRLIGSLYIPDPNIVSNPKWINGSNTFVLIDTPSLNNLSEVYQEFISNTRINESSADTDFTSGAIREVEATNILTTRTIDILSSFNRETTNVTNRRIPPPSPPPKPLSPSPGGGGGPSPDPPPLTPEEIKARQEANRNARLKREAEAAAKKAAQSAAQARAAADAAAKAQRRFNNNYTGTDPLAQSFYVTSDVGIFLTSVDVFFETKDEEIPVTLQIRPMIAGVPSSISVPFSEVTLDPDQINLSTDGSIETRFIFPSPVYLSGPKQLDLRKAPISNQQDSQYAVVLLSRSPQYRVFIAELGKNDIETNVRLSQQPTLGSLFKSQNGITWSPAQLENLKFILYRASFQDEGLVRFFNPKLSLGNGKLTVTGSNQILPLSKRIIVGLGSTGYDVENVVPGVTLTQGSASGKLFGIGGSISSGAGLGLTVTNVGFGYTVGSFSNIELKTETGSGFGAVAVVDVDSSGISLVTITNGGFGYQIGDSLRIPETGMGQNVGFGGRLSVINVESNNSFVIDGVQGQFSVGISTLNYINSSGEEVPTGPGVAVTTIVEDPYYDGLHMKIYHMNHGMHSPENYVKIRSFRPSETEVNSTILESIDRSDLIIPLVSTSGFETFEGINVDQNNPGYIIIGEEIISYVGYTANSLLVDSRGIDFSPVQSYPSGTFVYKYEFDGISLRRINKTHNFAEVDIESHPIDIDSYFIKVDTSNVDFDGNNIGKNRNNDLYFNKTDQSGYPGAILTNNIQFESITPNVSYIIPVDTNINCRVRTFTGTSISGNEKSFVDVGFNEIPLEGTTYFSTPRLICSDVNEERFITGPPGNKSFTMEFLMTTNDSRVSPVIDTIRVNAITTSNLINSPNGVNEDSDYENDDTIRSLYEDNHATIYISNPISLKIPANSIKVLLSASRNDTNDVRVLYRLFRDDAPQSSENYELFPGYSNYNIDGQGIKRIIDPSLNDGTADSFVRQTSNLSFYDYEYSVDDLPDFNGFAIKIVMSGTNQATPPIIRQLRAIATTKPRI